MAWQIRRVADSNRASVTLEPRSSSFSAEWHVWNDDPAYDGQYDSTWTVLALIKNNTLNIPFIGERLVSGATDAGLAQLIISDLQVVPIPSKANAYRVVATGDAPLVGIAPYPTVKVTRLTKRRTVPLYVLPTSLPSNGSPPVGGYAPFPPSAFIPGTTVNQLGNPIMVPIRQEQVTVEYVRHLPAELAYTPGNWQASFAQIDKRNATTFLGYSAGFLKYEGRQQVFLTDQVVSVQDTFLYDEWAFLTQEVQRDDVGNVICDATPITIVNLPQLVTNRAYWFQLYPNTVEMNPVSGASNIIPPEIYTHLTTPTPAW
jgi:hypothetical protein